MDAPAPHLPGLAPARPAEHALAARLAAAALIDLPENRVVFRGREDRLEAALRGVFRRGPGTLYLLRDGGAPVALLRLVPWPHCKPRGLRPLLALPGLALTLRGAFGRATALHGAWAERDPARPHVHLDPLAVAPPHQGRGVGARLMRAWCAALDRAGAAGYLETASAANVRFYERFGFTLHDRVTALGVETRLLWRDPAPGGGRRES